MVFDIKEWYSNKKNSDVLFSYKGAITSGKITSFLDEIENRVDELGETPRVKRKIYNVLVESLQNIYHHAVEISDEIKDLCDDRDYDKNGKFGVIVLQKESVGYHLTIGNFVKKNRSKLVKDKIDQINALSIDEIKALYKLILNNHEFSERGGGGLGMIDVVKRTESKLGYNFYEYNDELYFYTLEINVY